MIRTLFANVPSGAATPDGIERLRGDIRCAPGDPAAALAGGACDVILAGCGGGTAEILRLRDRLAPAAPVILLSGGPAGEEAVELLKSGADDLIAVDRLERLPAAIDAALRKRALAQGELAARARLERAVKLEAMGRMAGVLAHDLNNMLGAIEGYATLGMRKLPETDQLWGDLGEIRRAVSKGAALTKQLLAFSRKQAAGRARLAPAALIEGLRARLLPAAGEKAVLEIDTGAGAPEVMAAGEQIEQLLLNLVLNARDAMPAGGAIKIGLAPVELDAARVFSPDPAAAGTRFARISVADSGTGMTPAVQARLFEPFFTTKGKGKGVGLGLATAYGIARQHNGWLEVRTEEGKGSEFSLFLPAAPAPSAERQAPAAPAAAASAGGRILIVEDDEDLRGIAVRALTDAGFSVSKAGTVAGALSLFSGPGLFDVVFTDVILPDGNATEMARRLLAIDPSVRLIFTSGHSQEGAAQDFISSGGHPFLLKPYSIDALLGVITERRDLRKT